MPLVFLTLVLAFVLPLPAAEARSPQKGDFFTYKTEEFIENGDGEYYGYSDKTVSDGRYEVDAVSPDNITVSYIYEWSYTSDTEPSTSGNANNRISFHPGSGQYTEGFDLDQRVGQPAFVWFWIPPGAGLGETVRILDKNFTVTGVGVTVWSNWVPRLATELTESGSFTRSDDYGDFYASYTDRYYFDADSGYIIAERYTEHDSGLYEGESASFDWKFNFDVSETSYPLSVDWGSVAGYYVMIPAFVFALLFGIYYGIRWRPREIYLANDRKVRLRRLWRRTPFIWQPGSATRFFGPFMTNIVDKARAAGDRVAIAYDHDELAGLAIYHKDAKVGSLFAPDKYVNEALRKFVGAKDFFSETRHQDNRGSSNADIYNIYETHKILVNRNLAPFPFDPKAVRPMTPEDLPAVSEISKRVYRIRATKWYATLLRKGDVGLVAIADGKIAGFAFATVIEGWARLHTLTVAPEHRGRGLGKELMRARLSTAFHLGATAAMVEIAEWNLPSLRISTSMGFAPEGSMYVESARRRRKERTIVRR